MSHARPVNICRATVFSMNNRCKNPRNGAIPVPVATIIISFDESSGNNMVFPTGPATCTVSPDLALHKKLLHTPILVGSTTPVTGSTNSARRTHKLTVVPSNKSPYRVLAIEYKRGLCGFPLSSTPGGMTESDCPST